MPECEDRTTAYFPKKQPKDSDPQDNRFSDDFIEISQKNKLIRMSNNCTDDIIPTD